jgi:hypothetical protein
MVLLSLMVLSRKCPGTKYSTIVKFILIELIQIAFMPLPVDTSSRVHDDFNRLLFLHAHREASALTNELPEETDVMSAIYSITVFHSFETSYSTVAPSLVLLPPCSD